MTEVHSVGNNALVRILSERFDQDVGDLYEGAVRVLSDDLNRARVTMAAAALRQMMDELEEAAGYRHSPPDWKSRVAKLEKSWDVAQKSLAAETDSGGSMHGASLSQPGFERELNEFFAAARALPPRRKLAEGTVQDLDPSKRVAAPTVQMARGHAWMARRQHLNDVVHHNVRPDAVAFSAWVSGFEAELLAWLRPRTFLDLDAIDALLLGGPPSA